MPQLDKVATDFLRDYYPAALKITPYGQPPVSVDPLALAKKADADNKTAAYP